MDLTFDTIGTKVIDVVRNPDYRKGIMPQEVNGMKLVTTGELATILGKHYITLVNWRNTHADFPKPVIVLNPNSTKPRNIYNADEVVAWAERMTQVGFGTRGNAAHLGSRLMRVGSTHPETFHAIMRMLDEVEASK